MDASTALGINNARAQTKLVRDLRQMREENGLTLGDVAESMGREINFVIEFEKGGMNFSAATLRDYARAVGAELHFQAVRPKTGNLV